jgi:hypothetical protein
MSSTPLDLVTLRDVDVRQQWEEQGRQIGKQNPNLARFGQVLSHPEFAAFFEQNFSTVDDAKQAIMLLKTGMAIQNEVVKQVGEPLDGNQLTAVLKMMIDRSDTRQFMVHQLLAFLKDYPNSTNELQ